MKKNEASDIIVEEGYKIQKLEEVGKIKAKDKSGKSIDVGTNWPIVYIMYNKKEKTIYVGQTVNVIRRMKEHKNEENFQENKLFDFWITYFTNSNLSMTINLENQLIRLLAAEKTNTILNRNDSSSHEYFGKTDEEKDLEIIWKKLLEEKIVTKSLKEVRNQELYKLSPFITLTNNQSNIINSSINVLCLKEFEKIKDIIINGLPGTGKTIMALHLAKQLKRKYEENKKDIKIAIVTPINEFNETLKKVVKNIDIFKDIKIFNPTNAVNDYLLSGKKFDVLIIDEAHRLKFCLNNKQTTARYRTICKDLKLTKNDNTSEINQLEWLMKISKKRVILYDEFQSIRREDLKKADLERLTRLKMAEEKEADNYFILKEPIRIKVKNYIEYIEDILQIDSGHSNITDLELNDYELCMTKDLKQLENILKGKQNSRLIAGDAWEWISKNRKNGQNNYEKYFDFEEYYYKGEYYRENLTGKKPDFKKKWNRTNSGGWCETEAAKKLDEIGCVHTIQGYDVDYIGVIFGREIIYRDGKIRVNRAEYKDRGGYSNDMTDEELVKYIKNIYRILMTRGMKGTYIYVFDKELREYIKKNFKEIKLV